MFTLAITSELFGELPQTPQLIRKFAIDIFVQFAVSVPLVVTTRLQAKQAHKERALQAKTREGLQEIRSQQEKHICQSTDISQERK